MIKTTKLTKIFLIIFLVMLPFILISCQPESGIVERNGSGELAAPSDIDNYTTDIEENEDIDPRDIPDRLPEKDLSGRDFNVLCHEMLTVEFVAEELTGEIVNDAIFRRNTTVAERFNVNINMIHIPGSWADRESYMGTIRRSVAAGDTTYDLIAGVASFIPNLVPEGIFMDLNTVNYLDFANPWWGEDLARELAIGERLFLVTGDIALSMWDCLFVFYFSKQLAIDHGLPNLYDIVRNNQWTFGKLSELSRMVSQDLDGDGVFDENDMFGFVTTTGTVVNAFPKGFNMATTNKDTSNIPYPQLDMARWASAAEKLVDFHFNTVSSLVLPDGSDDAVIVPMFQENRALFWPQTLSFARDLRAMETDFGILPFPMYDENQQSYRSVARNAMSLMGIPVTVSSPDDAGLIMEALAAESFRTVIPAYYDVALRLQYTRDDESGEMLDIIRDNLWMNFGYVFSLSTGSIGNYMREMIEQRNSNFASFYERTIDSRTAIFNTFIENVLNLD